MSTMLSMTQSLALGHSRAYCERLTKAKARNFYYGLKLLPEPKRSAMFALSTEFPAARTFVLCNYLL